jgi:hypothetical protein
MRHAAPIDVVAFLLFLLLMFASPSC